MGGGGGASIGSRAEGVNQGREGLMTQTADQALPAHSRGREGHLIEYLDPEWMFSSSVLGRRIKISHLD